jgi:hypothetical protein
VKKSEKNSLSKKNSKSVFQIFLVSRMLLKWFSCRYQCKFITFDYLSTFKALLKFVLKNMHNADHTKSAF